MIEPVNPFQGGVFNRIQHQIRAHRAGNLCSHFRARTRHPAFLRKSALEQLELF